MAAYRQPLARSYLSAVTMLYEYAAEEIEEMSAAAAAAAGRIWRLYHLPA